MNIEGMLVKISKTFDFDAAHWLPGVPEGHKCRRMHGHTYRVELMFQGTIDERGMVLDYAEIADAWEPIRKVLDHHILNEIPGLENPTTEYLAPWIAAQFAVGMRAWHVGRTWLLRAVRVYESSTTWCEVEFSPALYNTSVLPEREWISPPYGRKEVKP